MKRESLILLSLFVLTTILALTMGLTERATWLEALGFVTGALCVWLTVRENIWNFPLGLVNVAAFGVVFLRAELYADAGLQVVYFVLGILGWYWWLFGGEQASALDVRRATPLELLATTAVGTGTTFLLWELLTNFGSSASFWDALTTSMSLCAQWLLTRKRLENWWFWIVVDIIYVPLYLYKELYLTAILYAVFLCMATLGLLRWQSVLRKQVTEIPLVAEPRGIA
jgi:nicotinamide mononucleotide transporter